jgi:hypothetical protein
MRARGAATAIVAIAVVGTAGCLRWEEIKPTELPKLNGAYAQNVGAVPTAAGTQMVVEGAVAHVERPDGTQVEISGRFHADVTTAHAGSFRFKYPVSSVLQNDVLVIEGGNRGQTPIPLGDVTSVQVSRPSPGRTTLAIVLGVGGGLALLLFLANLVQGIRIL